MLLELLYNTFIEWVEKSDRARIKTNVKNFSEKNSEAKRRTIKKNIWNIETHILKKITHQIFRK